jgi:hypothetical protein
VAPFGPCQFYQSVRQPFIYQSGRLVHRLTEWPCSFISFAGIDNSFGIMIVIGQGPPPSRFSKNLFSFSLP